MTYLATRVTEMAPSETLAMSQKSKDLAAKGFNVINLAVGEPDFHTPDFIKNAGKQGIDENYTLYPPVPGYLDLREAICLKLKRDNGVDYKPNQIIVSNGAKHSIMNVILALVNPGDEVVMPTPCWVSYPEMVQLVGGIPVSIFSGIEQDFKVTAAQIDAAITPKTKLLMLNSPSNPTGSVYSHEELKAIADVVAKHPHVYVMSDEIYELISFEKKHECFAQFPEIKDRVIIVNGVAKGWAMTGWRIGYLAANAEIADACNKIQGQMTSACSSIAQRATIAAMLQDPKECEGLKEMVKTFKNRRDLVLEKLRQIPGVKTNTPTGAFYIFADVSAYFGKSFENYHIKTGADMANYLLDTAHIALVGGDAFGNKNCIRISYATSEDKLIDACERLKKALEKLN
ncbi:MAG: pyridoxal phosphate-dependent aminotransferase [Bacteroidales bacterium]|nr:pyridoxal phosphate-dependent aminotransferase [Bacteroidales bacterium]